MNKIITFSFFLIALNSQLAKAQPFQFDSVGYISVQIGKIVEKGDTWVIRVGEGNAIKDYLPMNLPENLKINNQQVVFEGPVGKIPPQVRMAGTPIELNVIRKLYKTKPKDTDQSSTTNQNQLNAFDSVGSVQNGSGRILVIAGVYVIEQTDNNNLRRFVPDYMPEDFREINLKISFSGIIGKIDPNIKAMGAPFQIKEIMAIDDVQFDESQIQEPLKNFYPIDSAGFLEENKGVIRISNDLFLIEMENGTQRYLPILLPQEFKEDGMVVIVSGIIGKIPANVRLVGTPLEIKTIKKGR